METIVLDEDMINTKSRFSKAIIVYLPLQLFRLTTIFFQLAASNDNSGTTYHSSWPVFLLAFFLDILPTLAMISSFREPYFQRQRVFLKTLNNASIQEGSIDRNSSWRISNAFTEYQEDGENIDMNPLIIN